MSLGLQLWQQVLTPRSWPFWVVYGFQVLLWGRRLLRLQTEAAQPLDKT
ncbi:MAG: hypothetical protein HC821_04290 [Lewinella sp.]|nr:hypothetical protein [Lewinella sp.]